MAKKTQQEYLEEYIAWQEADETHLKHWRAWGSWFSWGSPIGLSIFLLSLAGVVWIIAQIF
jgi:hypothetical protein